MSDSPPQSLTPEICATLPAPLADRIDEMLEEIATSGEHTTADETADVIEALMAHLVPVDRRVPPRSQTTPSSTVT